MQGHSIDARYLLLEGTVTAYVIFDYLLLYFIDLPSCIFNKKG